MMQKATTRRTSSLFLSDEILMLIFSFVHVIALPKMRAVKKSLYQAFYETLSKYWSQAFVQQYQKIGNFAHFSEERNLIYKMAAACCFPKDATIKCCSERRENAPCKWLPLVPARKVYGPLVHTDYYDWNNSNFAVCRYPVNTKSHVDFTTLNEFVQNGCMPYYCAEQECEYQLVKCLPSTTELYPVQVPQKAYTAFSSLCIVRATNTKYRTMEMVAKSKPEFLNKWRYIIGVIRIIKLFLMYYFVVQYNVLCFAYFLIAFAGFVERNSPNSFKVQLDIFKYATLFSLIVFKFQYTIVTATCFWLISIRKSRLVFGQVQWYINMSDFSALFWFALPAAYAVSWFFPLIGAIIGTFLHVNSIPSPFLLQLYWTPSMPRTICFNLLH